ncbi:hypothetical protein G7054_g11461 [Neopestalotiopsis clavispora]|nr:hypothetical protein G7054_g11461 [Neopestalotiopsis clavispora]
MPSTTSPSDFIYQRPFCSDSARAEPSTTIYHGEEGGPTNHGAGYVTTSSGYAAHATNDQYHELLAHPPTGQYTAPPCLLAGHQQLKCSHCCGASHTESLPKFEPAITHIPLHSEQASYHHTQENTTEYSKGRRISLATESTLGHRTFSTCSNASDQIEQLCDALNIVHDICLEATRAYLGSHHANRQARASHSNSDSHHCRSEDPITAIDHENKTSDVPEDPYHGPTASSRAHPVPYQDGSQTTIPHISSSLLKNISNICNMLWAGSQRDRLTVLNVERLAVDNMAKLLLWGETVVLDDSEGKALNDRETFHRVLDAGKHLCVWLGAQESLRDMEELGRAWPYASDQM